MISLKISVLKRVVMRSILMLSSKRFCRLFVLIAALPILFVSSPVWSDNSVGSATLTSQAITNPSATTPAKKAELAANRSEKNFAERAKEQIQSAISQMNDPSRLHPLAMKRPMEMTSAYGQNQKVKTLKDKGDDVQFWYNADNHTPRQIKLKPKSRKLGKVLMEAVPGGSNRQDQDKKTAREFLRANGPALRIMRPDDELMLTRYQEDDLQRRHLRYQQKYKGILVWPAELNVHLDAQGNVDVINASLIPTPLKLVTKPVVNSQAAEERARKAVQGGESATVNAPELIVFTDGGKVARLAWKMMLSVGYDAYWLVVIDAHNGNVLTAYNQVNNVLTNGSGTDLFGTTRQLGLWLESDKYYLVDTSKVMYDAASDPPAINTTNGAIIVNDMAHTDLPDQGGAFTYQLITSTIATTGWLADGVSLAYCLSQTYDYYRDRHALTSIDGKGSSILGFTRVGNNYKNAFWSPGLGCGGP